MGPAWTVSYCTDQQMMPYFSGGSTINGTPSGDRWARVLGGQIGWLSSPLHRVDADGSLAAGGRVHVRARIWKCKLTENTKQSAPPKTQHEIHSSPATATTSRRRATKHVPRVRPYSPASIDPGIVEIGFIQLSQSVKTTNVTHTLTRHTN